MRAESMAMHLRQQRRLSLAQVQPRRLLIAMPLAILIGFLALFYLSVGRNVRAADHHQPPSLPVHQTTSDAGLTIQIRSHVTATTVGGILHYTMTVANPTAMTKTNVVAITMLPSTTSFLSGTVTTQVISAITQTLKPGGYYDPQFHAIGWVDTLSPNTTVNVRFTVKVKEGSNCRNAIQTTAALEPALLTDYLTDTVTVTLLCNAPVIELAHTSNVAAATFHDLIEYQVSIDNRGLVTATNLALAINIPAPIETTYMTDTLTASSGNAVYDADAHALRWAGTVPAQRRVTLRYTIKLTEFITCKTLYSQARVEAPSLPTPVTAIAKVEYRCPQIKALQFTMRASVTQTAPGSTIDYRLTLTNASDLPTANLKIVNPLPFGTAYVAGSAPSAGGTVATYDPIFKEVLWTSELPERSTVELSFQARIRDRVHCGLIINNQATVYNTGMMQPATPTISARTTVTCTEAEPWTDFGDAPDSESNHHGMDNIAYKDTGVLGRFPTVWEGTPANEGSGPTHRTGHVWLGREVNAEVDADLTLNNGNTNILYIDSNSADLDYGDDGWENLFVPMVNCESSTVVVRVTRNIMPITLKQLWLNVWLDGNRDGDWQDSGDCPNSADPLNDNAFEWIVQDWAVDLSAIPVDHFLDLKIPTRVVYNPKPTHPVWMRFTLSEKRALRPMREGLADGRGPAYPDFFQIGETEDYLVDGLPQGEPIQVSLRHPSSEDGSTPTVRLGSKAGFEFIIEPTTGTMPATALFQNDLPPGVTLVGQPEFLVFTMADEYLAGNDDGVTPLVTTFLPNEGSNGRIEWRGRLRREVGIWIYYEVEVHTCPPPDASGQPRLSNVAQLQRPDGTIVTAEGSYQVDCIPTGITANRLFLPLVQR
ncbi:MAG: DUF11 domain-containing protein [Caldilinea sp. CFX5]|nr:DUF11 domain-containing protein [Caldilinea sp. CFX5]